MEFRGQCGSGCHRPGASDLKDAPSITFSPATVDLGTVGEKGRAWLHRQQHGQKRPAKIKRMHGDGIAITRFPVRLKPGKSGECRGSVKLSRPR